MPVFAIKFMIDLVVDIAKLMVHSVRALLTAASAFIPPMGGTSSNTNEPIVYGCST